MTIAALPRGLPFFVAAAGLFVLLAATAGNPGATAAETVAPVTLQGFAFKPPSVTVPSGSQVTWSNKDGVIHTVTASAGGFDSGAMSTDGVFTFTFKSPGTFEYFCD
ncbi:MAG: cupredoxin domain-containing protein, partial [Chloroflexota bacterium]